MYGVVGVDFGGHEIVNLGQFQLYTPLNRPSRSPSSHLFPVSHLNPYLHLPPIPPPPSRKLSNPFPLLPLSYQQLEDNSSAAQLAAAQQVAASQQAAQASLAAGGFGQGDNKTLEDLLREAEAGEGDE